MPVCKDSNTYEQQSVICYLKSNVTVLIYFCSVDKKPLTSSLGRWSNILV